MSDYSTFLFARPSFIEGFGRILDVGGSLNQYNTDDDADTTAILMDWLAVSADFRKVFLKTIDAMAPEKAELLLKALTRCKSTPGELVGK